MSQSMTVKGFLYLAIRKVSSLRGYLIRVGYSTRDTKSWVSLYRHEGFKARHVRKLEIINQTDRAISLEQAREILLLLIAKKLNDLNISVEKNGDANYSYVVKSKKPVMEVLDEYKDGFVVKEETEEKKDTSEQGSGLCLVM